MIFDNSHTGESFCQHSNSDYEKESLRSLFSERSSSLIHRIPLSCLGIVFRSEDVVVVFAFIENHVAVRSLFWGFGFVYGEYLSVSVDLCSVRCMRGGEIVGIRIVVFNLHPFLSDKGHSSDGEGIVSGRIFRSGEIGGVGMDSSVSYGKRGIGRKCGKMPIHEEKDEKDSENDRDGENMFGDFRHHA